MYICFGTVLLPEGKRISYQRVVDVEAAMVHYQRPPFNTVSKRGYKGRNILILNTGKIGTLDKVISDDLELLSLLRKSFVKK